MTYRISNELAERPFPAHPAIDRYFPARLIEEARERLSRAIDRGDGPGLLIGASGTGKTLLLEVLAAQFRSRFEIASLSCAQLCTRRALLQAILFELGLPYRYHDEGELRLTLLDHLLRSERCPNGMLLLVDEAQSLPSRLLEEIRLMSNLVRDGQPRVRVVVAGVPTLEDLFANAELESFQQRIATRCYLGPLTQSETAQYVRAHLAVVGMEVEPTFDAAALDAVYEATDGVPRLVNQLCDRVILLTQSNGQATVNRVEVQQAWADLQQLPAPWETHPESLSARCSEAVIEFGELVEPGMGIQPTAPQAPVESEPVAFPISDSWEPFEEASPFESGVDFETRVHDSIEQEILEPTTLDDDDDDHDDEVVADNERPVTNDFAANRDDESVASAPSADDDVSFASASVSVEHPQHQAEKSEELAYNPFGEPFQDEEVVLENFAFLGDALGVRSPRVAERSAGEHMSAAVSRVLDVASHRGVAFDSPRGIVRECDALTIEVSEEPLPLEAVPLVSLVTDSPATSEHYCDPVYPEDELELVQEATELAASVATIRYPGLESDVPEDEETDVLSMASTDSSDSLTDDEEATYDEDSILEVEEAPADVAPHAGGVHRQDYRQLFANLRRKE